MINKFKSTNNLDFLSRPWKLGMIICPKVGMHEFKVGDIHGLYRFDNDSKYLIINSVINDTPGNGHFKDLIEWFEFSCKNCKYDLVFEEIISDKLVQILYHYKFEKLDNRRMIKRYGSKR